MYKELNEEIRNLKSDFHKKIFDSKEEYHNWINTNKKLYPDKITKSIAYDVRKSRNLFNTFIFILFLKLKDLIKKTFEIIPQRNNIVPKNIKLNTSRIADYICNKYSKLFDYA